jgi:hypothetical protein
MRVDRSGTKEEVVAFIHEWLLKFPDPAPTQPKGKTALGALIRTERA